MEYLGGIRTLDDFEWLKDKVEKLAGHKEEIARLYELVKEMIHVKGKKDRIYVKGNWAFKKLMILWYYIDIFTNVLKNEERNLVYIDLMAGPGFNLMKDINLVIAGSPLIAELSPRILKSGKSKKFDAMFLVDIDERNCQSLRKIIPDATVLCLDCNSSEVQLSIQRLLKPEKSFFLAFIDPEGTEIHWDTLKYLARKRGDFVINYPHKGIGRLYGAYQGSSDSTKKSMGNLLDSFFGTKDWREIDCSDGIAQTLYEFYLKRLRSLRKRIIDFDISDGGYKILIAARETPTGSPWLKSLFRLEERSESITDRNLKILVDIYRGDQEQLTKYLQ